MKHLKPMLCALAITIAASASSHEVVRGGPIKPRVGQISTPVALGRLRLLGFTDVRVMDVKGSEMIAAGKLRGAATQVRVDLLRGQVTEVGKATRKPVVLMPAQPSVVREQVPITREEMVVPARLPKPQ
jgi:hypothetical protein